MVMRRVSVYRGGDGETVWFCVGLSNEMFLLRVLARRAIEEIHKDIKECFVNNGKYS